MTDNKPNPDLDKECSHKFEPFKPGLCICEICYQVRPAVKKEASDSALEVLRTLIGFMADIELPDELRKSKELADAYATIRGTVSDSAEPGI